MPSFFCGPWMLNLVLRLNSIIVAMRLLQGEVNSPRFYDSLGEIISYFLYLPLGREAGRSLRLCFCGPVSVPFCSVTRMLCVVLGSLVACAPVGE